MYEELASVRGIVDLPPEAALDDAQSFVANLGYTIVQRAGNLLTVERRSPHQAAGQAAPVLTVAALPQPGGGVKVAVRGNDREGMQEHQAAWAEWSENLPKKPEEETQAAMPPPPTVESPTLPPAPQPATSYAPPLTTTQRSGMGTGAKLALGGCIGLILLSLVTVGGCFALVANVDSPTEEAESASSAEEETTEEETTKARRRVKPQRDEAAAPSPPPPPPSQAPEEEVVRMGQPVTVGDASWTVTSAQPRSQLNSRYADSKQGNFVVVDFTFTNNGTEAKTLHSTALKLLDSNQREFDPDTDTFGYIPNDRDIFLEQVNPGLTEEGQVIFSVAPDATGFRLEVSDTNWFKTGKAYVDLGF